jgi:hypothetical protein
MASAMMVVMRVLVDGLSKRQTNRTWDC